MTVLERANWEGKPKGVVSPPAAGGSGAAWQLNKVAPLVLALLVVVAVAQVWSSRGGTGVSTDGIVSDADVIRDSTTTTVAQRTFVSLAPLPEQPTTASTRTTRTTRRATTARPPSSAQTTASSSTETTDPAPPTTDDGSSTTDSTDGPTTTEDGPTTTGDEPTTTESTQPTSETTRPTRPTTTGTVASSTTRTDPDRPPPTPED